MASPKDSNNNSQSTASVSGEVSQSGDDSSNGASETVTLTQLGPVTDGGPQTVNEEVVQLCHCSRCELPIHDRFVYKVLDRSFHERCLQCADCTTAFSSTCFIRQGALYCRDHFRRRFGPKCSRCQLPLDEQSVIRRANGHVYHVACFQCVICKRELATGDQFYLIPMDGRLVCRNDYENAAKESEMDCSNKRPRTTISAKSLETLKQAYQSSSKPARHVREQLAQETGLDMRVVQVWFQNRRAKEKRIKKDAGRRWATESLTNNGFNKTFDSDSGSNDESLTGRSPLYASSTHHFAETPNDLDMHADLMYAGGYLADAGHSGTMPPSFPLHPHMSNNGYPPVNETPGPCHPYDMPSGPMTPSMGMMMPPHYQGPQMPGQSPIMNGGYLPPPPPTHIGHLSPSVSMGCQMPLQQPMSVGGAYPQ